MFMFLNKINIQFSPSNYLWQDGKIIYIYVHTSFSLLRFYIEIKIHLVAILNQTSLGTKGFIGSLSQNFRSASSFRRAGSSSSSNVVSKLPCSLSLSLSWPCLPQLWIHSHETILMWWLTWPPEFLGLHCAHSEESQKQRTSLS